MSDSNDIQIEPVTSEKDIVEAYKSVSEAFGRQARDAIWIGFNPEWDTPEGQEAGAARLLKSWQNTKTDRFGRPTGIFLKATLPHPEDSVKRKVVGFAVWVEASDVEGFGDPPRSSLATPEYLATLRPDDEKEQRFLGQVWAALLSRRMAFVAEKAAEYNKSNTVVGDPAAQQQDDEAPLRDQPNVLALDLCATHPAYQRRGVAAALVQWGIEEAKRRGIRTLTTEASAMGRGVYARQGFVPYGGDFAYEGVDEEFQKTKVLPPNVFMVLSRE